MQDEEQQNFIEIVGEAVDELNADIQREEYKKGLLQKLLQSQNKRSPVFQLVLKVDNLSNNIRIVIKKKEKGHNTAHFHVEEGGHSTPFSIMEENQEIEIKMLKYRDNRKLYQRVGKEVKAFRKKFRQDLICIWNNTRADDMKSQKVNCQICNDGLCSYRDGEYKGINNTTTKARIRKY